MGRRAAHPLPPSLFDLKWSQQEGKYIITRSGITYHLDFHHYNDLKAYVRQFGERATVEQWYNGLSKEDKNAIYRKGLPEKADDFFPDPEWE